MAFDPTDIPGGKFSSVAALTPGQNASVFRAVNDLLDRAVFLKAYPFPATEADSALHEPRRLQALEHPNLTKIFSADVILGVHVLLEMEFLPEGSFNDLIERASAAGVWPSIHQVLRLVSDAAAGLDHLHNHDLVHRDIKPANLMLRMTPDLFPPDLMNRLEELNRDFIHDQESKPPSAGTGQNNPETVADKWVSLGYTKKAGIDDRVVAEGYELCWVGADDESDRVDLHGWEYVLEKGREGPVRLKVRDTSVGGHMVLLKRKRAPGSL